MKIICKSECLIKKTKNYHTIVVVEDSYIYSTNIKKPPPDLKKKRTVYLDGTKIIELPAGLEIKKSLNLSHSDITELPFGLKVGVDLDISFTKITELPFDLEVGGELILYNTNITNYPVVYNCGVYNRAIYLDLKDKSIIHIGCFKGTKEEAIKAISKEYIYFEKREAYINKVEMCFNMWKNTNKN